VSSILLGDIGGTNSRFALAGASGRPEQVRIIENDSVASLETAIARYLAEGSVRPSAAVLAIAAPIDDREEISLTNRADWRFRRQELAKRFGFSFLRIVNDFEAIAWSLLRVTDVDAHPLGQALAPRAGAKLALGPGTGLGVAALVPVNGGWVVVSSEGGHAAFGPREADEFEVFERLRRTHGGVSGETILSGPGLVHLMRAVDPQSSFSAPGAIVEAANTGERSAVAATQLFVRLLGRFAGSLALVFKAFGGVYIAGGVMSRFGALVDGQQFRAAFEAHPPYEHLLRETPVLLMHRSEPGLLGCAALAEELLETS
jgi:glucokinase